MITTILIILGFLFLLGLIGGSNPRVGYYPAGGLGTVLLIALILWACGVIR